MSKKRQIPPGLDPASERIMMPAEFRRAVGIDEPMLRQLTTGLRIVRVFRTAGGHRRFFREDVAVARRAVASMRRTRRQPAAPDDPLLTRWDLIDEFGVTVPQIDYAVRKGYLSSIRVNDRGHRRYRRSEVAAWLRERFGR